MSLPSESKRKHEGRPIMEAGSNRPVVTVEFVGIPRVKTGVPYCSVRSGTLGEVLQQVRQQFPALHDLLTESGSLTAWYRVMVDQRFEEDLQLPIAAGQTVLILSADIGG
ncbi:hypothetical protein HRbin36_01670 [bacterium HR36]|nr:hypothetical protein HRbin36_01670 [bacterium HR36]